MNKRRRFKAKRRRATDRILSEIRDANRSAWTRATDEQLGGYRADEHGVLRPNGWYADPSPGLLRPGVLAEESLVVMRGRLRMRDYLRPGVD